METSQRRLSEFLTLELHHSLGAYRSSADALLDLNRTMRRDLAPDEDDDTGYLGHLVRLMARYNRELNEKRASSDSASRHPPPTEMPLCGTPPTIGDALGDREPESDTYEWIHRFYSAILHVVDDGAASDGWQFATLHDAVMGTGRTPTRRADETPERNGRLQQGRFQRFERRKREAIDAGILDPSSDLAGEGLSRARAEAVRRVASSWMNQARQSTLTEFVVRALVEGHLLLHVVEAHLSAPLARRMSRLTNDKDEIQVLLRRSIAINTFVWSAARIAPWIFADSEPERRTINLDYRSAWHNVMPMRTMWISAQVSLLALLRRATARRRLGDSTEAYKDFHKLQHHVRDTLRRIQDASVHFEGAIEFLQSLDAIADYHIGELYRRDRDPVNALSYYERAFSRLRMLKQETSEPVIINSRWFVNLQLGLGKACYELGRHKASLRWYLLTWRSLLDLIAADTSGTVNPQAIKSAVTWVERVLDDPELRKRDLVRAISPVIDQIETFRVPEPFRGLASDVILRLGHLLFVLNLGDQRAVDWGQTLTHPTTAEHGNLAIRCVRRAWDIDRDHTLAQSDLLRLDFRVRRAGGPSPRELTHALESGRPVQDQWPGGGGTTERFSRVVDFVLLRQLRAAPPADAGLDTDEDPNSTQDREMARELLHSLLTHTDSIEARKSQVHQYLTRPQHRSSLPAGKGSDAATIELISLRRYSSPSPFLPRSPALRSHGGGYLVRIHPAGGDGRGFGIAVDPGPSYIEALYRCGFAVSDVDMVLVTHDHVDHATSLEPLLALRYERYVLGSEQPTTIVAGNESVIKRLRAIPMYNPLMLVRLDKADELQALNDTIQDRVSQRAAAGAPRTTVHLEALTSVLPGTEGHKDLMRHPSVGFILSIKAVGEHRSLAFTGDLPGIPPGTRWSEPWCRALSADVFVTHVSTAPLAELRKLALLGTTDLPSETAPAAPLQDDIAWINSVWKDDDELRGRLAYAYWLGRAADPDLDPVGDEERLASWQVPDTHPYLSGTFQLARAFGSLATHGHGQRLLVLGELSEELGSFRGKIGVQLNQRVFGSQLDTSRPCRAITADIGLGVLIVAGPERYEPVSVLCSTCDLDNDLAPVERFHPPTTMGEVCIKGENEGTFYSCTDHEPWSANEPVFLEKLERYDVFGF